MIQTSGLTKRYGSFTAVDGIGIDIPPGEIYGFLGPNGPELVASRVEEAIGRSPPRQEENPAHSAGRA